MNSDEKAGDNMFLNNFISFPIVTNHLIEVNC